MPILTAENQFKKGLTALVDHNYKDATVFFKRAIDVDLARRGDLVGPVTVELTWEDGSTERRQWDGAARWERWRLEDARRLEQVVIDPEVAWALETRRADNYWRQSPARPRDPLWWLRDALLNAGQLFLKWGF